MQDKLRDYFEDMVVYKDLKESNFFKSLSLPAFLRDWLRVIPFRCMSKNQKRKPGLLFD